MRTVTNLNTEDNFILKLKFDNGSEKIFDLKPYLQLPVFEPLTNPELFKQVVNKGYFIEWPSVEVDLSADTLWHEGKVNS